LALDQPYLFRSVPALQLLLAIDGFEYFVERLLIDQAMAALALAETIDQAVLVFVNRRSRLLVIPM
jgi:hypothetical protein